MKRRVGAGAAIVSGPGCEGIPAADPTHGASVAQYLATRPGRGPGAWYVRDTQHRVVFIVERHEDGVVTTCKPSSSQ